LTRVAQRIALCHQKRRARLAALQNESIELAVEGFQLHADVWQGGDDAQVLLLHGLGGNSITWHAAAPLLAEQLNARVVAVDLPGFGASKTGGRRVGMRLLSDVALAVMRNQAAVSSRWHVAGNSLGGLLALELLARAPEQVAHVTLASVALPFSWGRRPGQALALMNYVPAGLPFVGWRVIARYVRNTGVPGVVDAPIHSLFSDPSRLDPQLRERLIAVSSYRMSWADEAARALQQTTFGLALALFSPPTVRRWFRDVHGRVCAISGGKDPLYPESTWAELERVRPDWQHVRLPGVGHVPQLEAPQQFVRHMVQGIAGDPMR
jgi:pimeloyl-ACP methyl ester carboxylesterase